MKTFALLLRRSGLAMALAAATSLAAAGTIHVTVDTARFGASSGYLDLQLSANGGVPLATALVNNMSGFDPLGPFDSFGLTPTAGGYLFRNDTYNDLFYAATFGGLFSFDLTFAGVVDPATHYVSHFIVSAFDDNFGTLGKVDPLRGALADFSWTAPTSAASVGRIGVSVSDPAVTVVPEPGDLLLTGIALFALTLAGRRRQRGGV